MNIQKPNSAHASSPARFELHNLQSHAAHELDFQLADDVRRGLTAAAKRLPPRLFYDQLGSQLFEAICLTHEYYLTSAEDEILVKHHADIIRRATHDVGTHAPQLTLLELGSGNAAKTRHLIAATLRRQPTLHYQTIDISPSALQHAAHSLLESFPTLRVTAYAADYLIALRHLAARKDEHQPRVAVGTPTLSLSPTPTPTLALFLGSNIGNFDRAEAFEFLRAVREALRPGDKLLIGADLRKDPRILQAAYDDALGITAAFNLNLLARINRELAGDFEIKNFRHVALYNDAEGRMEMHIESTRDQVVRIKELDLTVNFACGERIHTENSYKYDAGELDALAARAGFTLEAAWLDAEKRFSSNLFRVAAHE